MSVHFLLCLSDLVYSFNLLFVLLYFFLFYYSSHSLVALLEVCVEARKNAGI